MSREPKVSVTRISKRKMKKLMKRKDMIILSSEELEKKGIDKIIEETKEKMGDQFCEQVDQDLRQWAEKVKEMEQYEEEVEDNMQTIMAELGFHTYIHNELKKVKFWRILSTILMILRLLFVLIVLYLIVFKNFYMTLSGLGAYFVLLIMGHIMTKSAYNISKDKLDNLVEFIKQKDFKLYTELGLERFK